MSEAPELEPHTLVLLRWPDRLPELTDEELDALQVEHVAYQRSLRERGIIAVAGPFDGQPDERWRGPLDLPRRPGRGARVSRTGSIGAARSPDVRRLDLAGAGRRARSLGH
jgi:hypothetical protein